MSKFHGQYFGKNRQVTVRLDLIEYNEDKIFYVYSPALDLVGYGHTTEEARQSWEVVLAEYVQYAMNKNTLAADLENKGWKADNKEFQPPTFSWMLQNNDDLSSVYNKHDFHKVSRSVNLPVACA